MNKERLIQLLEEELVQADAAKTDAAFDKHIYAIYKLTSLYSESERSLSQNAKVTEMPPSAMQNQSISKSKVTQEEIRRMGGKTPPSTNSAQSNNQRMVTDDEIGNGESIFDF
ncbi:DUF5327 family protein [Staphylococcus felis]|uniref:DUF5327 family protein n=1 Tax=Staphylococcus felis TaxID=46127 RepID=UPI000E27830F|nr:DUF5327 family protein [Staphylococcus felis]REH75045.1 hypothetical protein DOS60_09840 [Staphylococcus felis]REI35190.1 hypothetical protein DOS80_00405 [Staphylococcus felis]